MWSRRLTANVAELPVLEYEKVFPRRYLLEAFNCPVGEVVDDVGMGLEYAD